MAVGLDVTPDSQTRRTAQATTDTPVTLSVEEGQGLQGGTTWVPINVDNATDIAGGDLTLYYDPNVLEPVQETRGNVPVKMGTIAEGYNFQAAGHSAKPGEVRISVVQNQERDKNYTGLPGGSGALVKVQFTIKRSAPDGATPVTLASAQLNDTYGRDFAAFGRPVDVNHGQVLIGSSYMEQIFLPLVMRKK
jgi:hypothetical protein